MTTVVLPRRLRLPVAVPVAIGSAWLLALGAQVTGYGGSLHHDQPIEDGPPIWLVLAMFLLAWQVMIAAMMVPTSLPLAHLFGAATRRQPRPGLVMAAFLGGYALVWSVFGIIAFLADIGVHQLADRSAFLGSHEALISGGTLAVAAALRRSRSLRRSRTGEASTDEWSRPSCHRVTATTRGRGCDSTPVQVGTRGRRTRSCPRSREHDRRCR